MKILQLCHKPPYPPVDGGCLAMKEMAEMMVEQGIALHILSINTQKHPGDANAVPNKIPYHSITIDTSLQTGKALANLFGSGSYNIDRFYSEAMENKLKSLLETEQYDIVLLESLFVSPYIDCIQQHSKAKIVYRAHNVEYKLWEQFAQTASFPKRTYMNFLARRMKVQEMKTLAAVDGLLCISEADEKLLQRDKIAHAVIPMSYPIAPVKTTSPFKASFFQLAAMDWFPNEEAVDWFVKDIWPIVASKAATAHCELAGRKMPERFLQLSNDRLKIYGEISHKEAFFAKHDIMIVPLRSGSGVRVKIIEGLASGKTIISTSMGAEGIACTHGKNILIADTAEDFAALMLQCLESPKWAKTIAANGQAFAREHFSRMHIGKQLLSFYKQYGV